jgi:3,4-dihydroxyphenylacetate 2,3-dioxygenase
LGPNELFGTPTGGRIDMGEIVGAAIVSHVPPLVLPEATRREMNGGDDYSIVEGLHRMRRECLDRVRPDTIVVFDTHWFTTFEHVVTAHARRSGRFTSDELPRGNPAMPFDLPGDPQLAALIAEVAAARDDTFVHASSDEHLGIHYPTVYLAPFLQRDEAWMSVGVCQTAQFADFLVFGEVLAEAIRRSDRRVVLLASGGLSHKFWPLMTIRQHEGAGLEHIITPAARAADERVIELLCAGAHGTVLAEYPEFRKHSPEGMFAHYLMMVGALGGAECDARGVAYSDYESAAGTGQIHLWFDTVPA